MGNYNLHLCYYYFMFPGIVLWCKPLWKALYWVWKRISAFPKYINHQRRCCFNAPVTTILIIARCFE